MPKLLPRLVLRKNNREEKIDNKKFGGKISDSAAWRIGMGDYRKSSIQI